MKSAYDPNELSQLVERLLNENIDANNRTRLEEILSSGSEARREYFGLVDVHLGLRKLQSLGTSVEPVQSATAGELVVTPTRGSGLSMILTSAATFLIGVLVASWWFSADQERSRQAKAPLAADSDGLSDEPKPSDSSVILAQSDGAQFFGERLPAMGDALAQDRQYILTSGSVQLQFPTGATTILDSPAIFRIANSNRLVLEAGNCSVHAPTGAENFEVATPVTEVADLGTRFGISVKESGETDVQVVEYKGDEPAKSEAIAIPPSIVTADPGNSARASSQTSTTRSPARMQTDEAAAYYRYRLPDRILTYDAVETGEGVTDLTAIRVQRGNRIQNYSISEMIPSEVYYFNSNQVKRIQPLAMQYGDSRPVSELIHTDRALNTGLLNPGGSKTPLANDPVLIADVSNTDALTPGMAIRFKYPVVNCPGPDIAFFEIQSFSNPPEGDFFHISPVKFRPGLKAYTVQAYDIPITSSEAKVVKGFGLLSYEEPVHSLAALLDGKWKPNYKHENFRATAVGIDLSNLGYQPGESADELFIQDAADDDAPEDGSRVDPVYIGGFPVFTDPLQDQDGIIQVQ